jgi:hypothetical protein
LNNLLGFETAHISLYYAYLVANPNMAKAFMTLPFDYKLSWGAMFISEKFQDSKGDVMLTSSMPLLLVQH